MQGTFLLTFLFIATTSGSDYNNPRFGRRVCAQDNTCLWFGDLAIPEDFIGNFFIQSPQMVQEAADIGVSTVFSGGSDANRPKLEWTIQAWGLFNNSTAICAPRGDPYKLDVLSYGENCNVTLLPNSTTARVYCVGGCNPGDIVLQMDYIVGENTLDFNVSWTTRGFVPPSGSDLEIVITPVGPSSTNPDDLITDCGDTSYSRYQTTVDAIDQFNEKCVANRLVVRNGYDNTTYDWTQGSRVLVYPLASDFTPWYTFQFFQPNGLVHVVLREYNSQQAIQKATLERTMFWCADFCPMAYGIIAGAGVLLCCIVVIVIAVKIRRRKKYSFRGK